MPLITLTSDIGRQDFLTGAVKGQLLHINSSFNIVDISHELSPFNYPQAAYVCRNAIKKRKILLGVKFWRTLPQPPMWV